MRWNFKEKPVKNSNWKQFNYWHQSWRGQLMEQGREKSTIHKLRGLGSAREERVRNLLYSHSHLLWFPLKKKRAFQVKKPSMQAKFYVGYKTTLPLTLPARITIKLFLYNATSLPHQKVSLWKLHCCSVTFCMAQAWRLPSFPTGTPISPQSITFLRKPSYFSISQGS